MKNQCKIGARKSDVKMMENERKWSPNGSQNPLKIEKIDKRRGLEIDPEEKKHNAFDSGPLSFPFSEPESSRTFLELQTNVFNQHDPI